MRPRAYHSGSRAGSQATEGFAFRHVCRPVPERRVLSGQRGFTLIELLVVLTLIGLIAGTVGPNFFEAAQRMAGRNEAQQIRQQINDLPLAALHQQRELQINRQGTPFALPDGWRLIVEAPIIYQPNGVCLGGIMHVIQPGKNQLITLKAPFCQWP